METQPVITSTTKITKGPFGLEFVEVDGVSWKRKLPETRWERATVIHDHPVTRQLSLVRQRQDGPYHWSLFVAFENMPGLVLQVMGDSTHMMFKTKDNFDIIHDTGSFHDHYVLASDVSDGQFETIKQVCAGVKPPHAATMHDVTENCQGWTLRVLHQLVQAGVITKAKYEQSEAMQEKLHH